MSRLRTFLAVEVTPSIRGRLAELQETLARAADSVKWVEEENLHVTLIFLGDVDERDVTDVCRAVSKVCAAVRRDGARPRSRRACTPSRVRSPARRSARPCPAPEPARARSLLRGGHVHAGIDSSRRRAG